jgi:cytochrome c biogenesis protein CcdA
VFIAACAFFFVGDTVHAVVVGDAARAFRNIVMYAAGLITAFVLDVVKDD